MSTTGDALGVCCSSHAEAKYLPSDNYDVNLLFIIISLIRKTISFYHTFVECVQLICKSWFSFWYPLF